MFLYERTFKYNLCLPIRCYIFFLTCKLSLMRLLFLFSFFFFLFSFFFFLFFYFSFFFFSFFYFSFFCIFHFPFHVSFLNSLFLCACLAIFFKFLLINSVFVYHSTICSFFNSFILVCCFSILSVFFFLSFLLSSFISLFLFFLMRNNHLTEFT